MYLRFDLNENSTSVRRGWYRTAYSACVQWIFSKMALRWHRETERRRIVEKKLFLFSLHTKSILVALIKFRLNHWWRWTILTMSFNIFWTLTVLFIWQSMGQSQASLFHPKYLKNVSEDGWSFTGMERHGDKWLMTTFSFWGGVTL